MCDPLSLADERDGTQGATVRPGAQRHRLDRFDDVVEVLSGCQACSSIDEHGVTTDFTIGALSCPKAGDDAVALAVTGTTPDIDVSLELLVVRLAQNVMCNAQGELATDPAACEQAARKGPPDAARRRAHGKWSIS